MPEQNRVTPMGDVVAIPLRGAWTGNRGIIHADHQIVRFHASDLWITCALQFRGRWREQWLPHRWTHLYFHDEAVSFAAGHRPCAECRRDSYRAYQAAWARGLGTGLPSAAVMNRRLHAERIERGTHRRRLHDVSWRSLPDGAFVLVAPPAPGGAAARPWSSEPSWSAGRSRDTARVSPAPAAVTPAPSPRRPPSPRSAGYPVQIDAAAR